MLTEAEKAQIALGLVPVSRLRSLRHALLAQADDAAVASKALPKDNYLAAALRGKRQAYTNAADMVQRVIDGHALRTPPNSSARYRGRLFHQRRIAKRERQS
jgi:hypothetical protein